MNIYNRCFDDQSQPRIRLETAAIEGIFEYTEKGAFELVWSFMLDYENSLNPHQNRREWVELSSRLCTHRISSSSRILALARGLTKSAKIKPRDALHLACKVKAINPVEFIRKEGEAHGEGQERP
jgi:hypothetical protein